MRVGVIGRACRPEPAQIVSAGDARVTNLAGDSGRKIDPRMSEEPEIPIKMSDVFTALARRDLLQAADMRDLEDRAKELTARTSNTLSGEMPEDGFPETQQISKSERVVFDAGIAGGRRGNRS
jgi:hypothetical protein